MTQPTDNMSRERENHLTIQQQNINKSLTTQSDFLHQLNPDTHDLSTIQELYLDHNHNSCATHQWYTLYPKQHYLTPSHMRSLLLVNKCIATDTWTQVDFRLLDIMVVLIQMGHGKVLVINIYNDMVHWATTTLDGYPSHSDKSHYIQKATSVYICGTTFCEPWQSTLLALSLLPSTYFWLTFASI